MGKACISFATFTVQCKPVTKWMHPVSFLELISRQVLMAGNPCHQEVLKISIWNLDMWISDYFYFCDLFGLRCKQNFLGVWGRGRRAIISHVEYVNWSGESLSVIDFTKNESFYTWNWLHQRAYSVQTQHFYICIIYFSFVIVDIFYFFKGSVLSYLLTHLP